MRPLFSIINFFSPVNLSHVNLTIRGAKRTQEEKGGNFPFPVCLYENYENRTVNDEKAHPDNKSFEKLKT